MAEKGLPVQGARALVNAWGDANAQMMRKGAQKKTAAPKRKPKK